MGRYILHRTIGAVVVVWLVSVLVFLMIHAVPGDTLMAKLGTSGRLSDAQMAKARRELGIDRPLYVQYVSWVGHIFDGSMGNSLAYDGQTVSSRIFKALPVTIELALLAMIVAILIAIPWGILSAVHRDGPVDYLVRIISLVGISLPQFWVGIMVVIYGTLYFGYSLPGRYKPITSDVIGNLKDMWLPVLVLAFELSAVTIRMLRSTTLEVLNLDFVRTARAKGVNEQIILYRHVLRNALIPVVTVIGNQAVFVFSGALILEILFNFPGMGVLTYAAIRQRDYTQVLGNTLITASIIVGINLIIDLSYGLIDPRVRISRVS